MNKIEFGQYLKSLRKEKKLTLVKLAEISGVSNPYISQVENGKFTPTPETLSKLAKALDVDYFSLMRAAGHMDTDLSLGQIIKQQREKYKITIEELAKKIKLPLSKLDEVEKGELIPSSETLENISEVLELDYAEMMIKAGFWDKDKNFIDPFDKIDKAKKWVIKFEVPQMENIIDEKNGTVLTRVIPMEEALSRFLEVENLFTMEYPLYFQGKKLTSHQRNQLLQIAKIIFNPSKDKED